MTCCNVLHSKQPVAGGSKYDAEITINDLTTDDTGRYTMTATAGGSASAVTNFNLQVQGKSFSSLFKYKVSY